MKKLFWIILLIFVAFLIAYALVVPFKTAVDQAVTAFGGQAALTIGAFWAGVTANPVYQQYHMLIWLAGGVLLTVAVIKLWPRRPQLFTRATTQPIYQNRSVSAAPQLVQQSAPKTLDKPPPAPKAEPEKEVVETVEA